MKVLTCVALILCLSGCTAGHPQEILRAEASTDSYTVRQDYQAICRELLHATQAEFGEDRVHYELWSDVEEALIYAAYTNGRGMDWVIGIKSDGPASCRVRVASLHVFQRQRVARCTEGALARMASGQPAVR